MASTVASAALYAFQSVKPCSTQRSGQTDRQSIEDMYSGKLTGVLLPVCLLRPALVRSATSQSLDHVGDLASARPYRRAKSLVFHNVYASRLRAMCWFGQFRSKKGRLRYLLDLTYS